VWVLPAWKAGLRRANRAYDTLSRLPIYANFRMSLTHDEVLRIARLARLEVSPAEAETTREQLNGIFAFIEQLRAVDTEGIEPMAHAVDVVQRLREDKVTESDRRADFQTVAPETEAGLYLVPKVIE
jgi:aspartyl-tRNA(Asn)/glutamyl-tRNA(Gln) amidotransferase subunit C